VSLDVANVEAAAATLRGMRWRSIRPGHSKNLAVRNSGCTRMRRMSDGPWVRFLSMENQRWASALPSPRSPPG